jgi:Pretoxin HINT domain/Hemagglutinin repeat
VATSTFQSKAASVLYSNALLTAGGAKDSAGKELKGTVTAVSGRDMRFAGANVSGTDIYLDAGRDLVVASRQNKTDSNSQGFNFSVSFNPSLMPTGGSLGGSFGEANRLYTDTPTTIIAAETLDAYVGNSTFLLGAMLNSKAGKLKLDTGNFVFDHYGDKDYEQKISAQLNINLTNPTNSDANGSYYYHDKQGVTYATVGAGTITVRNKQTGPGTSLLALNRDAANLQRVVKDETINITIPTVNLVKVLEDIKKAGNVISALAADVPAEIKAQSTQVQDQFINQLLRGRTAAEARAFVTSPIAQEMLRKRAQWDKIAAIKGIGHDEALALMALIAKGESVEYDAKSGKYILQGDCNTASIPTPCQILINRGQLKASGIELSGGDVLAYFKSAEAALRGLAIAYKNGMTSEAALTSAQDNAKYAFLCVAGWMGENNDPLVYQKAVEAVGGTDRFYAMAYATNVDPIAFSILTNLPQLARAKDRAGIQDLRNWVDDAIKRSLKGFVGGYNHNDELIDQVIYNITKSIQNGESVDSLNKQMDLIYEALYTSSTTPAYRRGLIGEFFLGNLDDAVVAAKDGNVRAASLSGMLAVLDLFGGEIVGGGLKLVKAGNLVEKVGANALIDGITHKFDEVAGQFFKRTCSFAPDTPVLMGDGSFRPIASLRIGDLVASRNEFNLLDSVQKVTATHAHEHTDQVKLKVAVAGGPDEIIITTTEHPFWVEGSGFVRAANLRVGQRLGSRPAQAPLLAVASRYNDASGAVLVKAVTVEPSGVQPWVAHNLTVETDHTFFVGSSRAWVHNTNCWDALPSNAVRTGELTADGRTLYRGASGETIYQGWDGRFYNAAVYVPTRLIDKQVLADALKGSGYTLAEYDAYLARKLSEGAVARDAASYVAARNHWGAAFDAHQQAVQTAAAELSSRYPAAEGWMIVEGASFRTAAGSLTYPDLLAINLNAGKAAVLEVKTGGSVLSSGQGQLFLDMNAGTAQLTTAQATRLGLKSTNLGLAFPKGIDVLPTYVGPGYKG